MTYGAVEALMTRPLAEKAALCNGCKRLAWKGLANAELYLALWYASIYFESNSLRLSCSPL